jgi:hypothetical protein
MPKRPLLGDLRPADVMTYSSSPSPSGLRIITLTSLSWGQGPWLYHRALLAVYDQRGSTMFYWIIFALDVLWCWSREIPGLAYVVIRNPIRAFQRPTHERLARWSRKPNPQVGLRPNPVDYKHAA